MKLNHIGKLEIEEAAKKIRTSLNSSQDLRSIYWVEVGKDKYPFKKLIRKAHQQTIGNEKEWIEFNSHRIYRDYVQSLGFRIITRVKPIPYFTTQDIQKLSALGGLTYDQHNVDHQNNVTLLKESVWEKTRYWYDQILAELDGYTGSIRKVWSKRNWDKGKQVSAFKNYTWAKVFKITDIDKDIFFTVGVVGASQSLSYKLDYQSGDSSVLNPQQKAQCYSLLKESEAYSIKISIDDLPQYTWDKLVEETLSFINNNAVFYDKLIEEVWRIKEKRIARLTFNTNGWILPSGHYGKSNNFRSHEAQFEYGYEEWLFDISKLIDGYHYAFLEPIRKQHSAYSGNIYDVWLYTIDGESKKRYWVGEILNVEVLNPAEANEIKKEYKERKWLSEMERQLKRSGAITTGFAKGNGIDLFNVRFLPSNVKLIDPYFELQPNHHIYKHSRYSFEHLKDEFLIKDASSDDFKFISRDKVSLDGTGTLIKNTYLREPKTIEIDYLHKATSDKLTAFLIKVYGFENVTPEHPAGYGSNRIDIVVNDKQGLIFYEIKTYLAVKTSIRQALGQLLEYSSWTKHIKAKELIIVTPYPENITEVKTYMLHLRATFKLPIFYQYFDLERNLLSDKL